MQLAEEQRRKQLAHFLKTRRLRTSPDEAGILLNGGRRRTPGLRREELAVLSGISLPWYTALEQGRDIRVSEQVLESVARTLKLSADERNYMFALANGQLRSSNPLPADVQVSPGLQLILDRFDPYPAFVHRDRWDIIAWNAAASLLFGDFERMGGRERNVLWLMFMNEDYRAMYLEWEEMAANLVAQFRGFYAQNLDDIWYSDTVETLCGESPAFKGLWEKHDVSSSPERLKRMKHPSVGLLELQPNSFRCAEHADWTMKLFTPLPGTDSADKLNRLFELSAHRVEEPAVPSGIV